MQNAFIAILLMTLFSCSSNKPKKKLSSFKYQDSLSGIVVIDKDSPWEPGQSCKRLRYVKISGSKINSSFIGYQQAVVKLSNLARKMYGTHAKVRDFTDSSLFAHIWFCSSDYARDN